VAGELIGLAVIVVAVVVRGWPRRRRDRWSLTFHITRDRSNADDEKPPKPGRHP